MNIRIFDQDLTINLFGYSNSNMATYAFMALLAAWLAMISYLIHRLLKIGGRDPKMPPGKSPTKRTAQFTTIWNMALTSRRPTYQTNNWQRASHSEVERSFHVSARQSLQNLLQD